VLSGWFAGTRASGAMYENQPALIHKCAPACQPPSIRDRKTESRYTRYGEVFFTQGKVYIWRVISLGFNSLIWEGASYPLQAGGLRECPWVT